MPRTPINPLAPSAPLLALVPAIVLSGCAAPHQQAAEPNPSLPPAPAPVATAQHVVQTSLIAPDPFSPFPNQIRHESTSGELPPQFTLRIPPIPQSDRWTTYKALARTNDGTSIDPQTLSVLSLCRAADGSIQLLQTIEHDDQVLTIFEPPLTVIPARLDVGQTVQQSLLMTVRPLGDLKTIKTSGPATREITLIGVESVPTPNGEFEAHHVRSVLKAQLGSARVTVTTDTWLAPAIGIVAEDESTRVTVFGFTVRSSDTRLRLQSRADDAAGPLAALIKSIEAPDAARPLPKGQRRAEDF